MKSSSVKQKLLKFEAVDFQKINLNVFGFPLEPLGDTANRGLTPLITENQQRDLIKSLLVQNEGAEVTDSKSLKSELMD